MGKLYFFPEGRSLKTHDCGVVSVDATSEKNFGNRGAKFVPVRHPSGLFAWLQLKQVKGLEEFEVPDKKVVVNGVKEVSIADIFELCRACPMADGGDLEQIRTRQKVLGCSIIQKHWCSHPDERTKQAKNAKDGFCQSTGRKVVR